MPLAGLPGVELEPAFSPDGNQVAFSSGGRKNSGIYTTMVGGEKSLRLTSNSGDCSPSWSPDGRQVAFYRYFVMARNCDLCGSRFRWHEHRLYTGPAGLLGVVALDWSPDGKVLAFSEGQTDKRHLDCVTFARRFHHTKAYVTVRSGGRLFPRLLARRLDRGFRPRNLAGVVEDLYVVPAAGGCPSV